MTIVIFTVNMLRAITMTNMIDIFVLVTMRGRLINKTGCSSDW